MSFTAPLLLLLLLLLPLLAWMGWPAGRSRAREFLSLGLRLVIVACLILALAGLQIGQGGDRLAVVFLVDVSDSMPQPSVDAEVSYVRAAIRAMGPDDQSAVVVFGADALVERSMSAGRELGQISSAAITNQTDLAGAMRLGLALFPSGVAKRMLILSDGAQTVGDALGVAEFARASGVQIETVPFVQQAQNEVLLSAAQAPANLRPGEDFDLNVSVQASAATRAVIRVLTGDKIIYEQTHDLRRGLQTFSLPLTAGTPGFVKYQVQIVPEQDGFYQNNRLDAFSQVDGPPHILVVAPETGQSLPGGGTRPDEHSALVAALQAAGFTVDVILPALLPASLPELAQYNSVVLVDVPASLFSTGQMQNLQAYVRDLGGGLVAVGGPTSYGVGGYYDTPLEAALPVDMQIKDEKRRPTLAIVFIIDHSGSMSDMSGGVEKLELAKEAVIRSVKLLFPTDRVGVVAFDDAASWVVPLQELSDPGAVTAAVGSIRSGGGTDILAGLQAMANVLPGDPAKVKHVILLTDGGASPAGIPELVEKLHNENGISLSTVAIGRDAASYLEDLAVLGGGRYHFTANADAIPSIFAEETTLAMRAYIVEEPFFPEQANSSPVLSGIGSVPRLQGYVATSAKDLATVVLKSAKGDPILATWQYGLGRSLAFTSDATGRWGREWVQWQDFATFWAQAVRYTFGDMHSVVLQTSIALDGKQGSQAHLVLDARDRAGQFLNGYAMNANIVGPDGESQSVALRQIAPGRYEAFFDPQEQGVYLLHFSGASPADPSAGISETAGWTLSYSPEYRDVGSDPDLLLRLATLTGGQVASSDPADAFLHNLKSSDVSLPVWPWLLMLAAVLLPLDVASRRLILTRQDWLRFVESLAALLVTRRQQAAPGEGGRASPQMAALFQAKDRARDSVQAPPAIVQEAPLPESGSRPEEAAAQAAPEQQAEAPVPPEGSPSTTASLLARKKALRDKRHP